MNEPSSSNPHPHVRDSDICPLCKQRKDRGNTVCWNCYHRHNLRYGNPDAEALIDKAEAALSGASGVEWRDPVLQEPSPAPRCKCGGRVVIVVDATHRKCDTCGTTFYRDGCPKHLWGEPNSTCTCDADEASREELEAAGAIYDRLKTGKVIPFARCLEHPRVPAAFDSAGKVTLSTCPVDHKSCRYPDTDILCWCTGPEYCAEVLRGAPCRSACICAPAAGAHKPECPYFHMNSRG